MDPLSVSTGVLTVGGFALKACTELHGLVRGLQSQNRDARALKEELASLTDVLASLVETLANNPSVDLRALRLPLQRCGESCDEYRRIIEQCTRHSAGGERSRPSVRDWIAQRYLQGDINDFRAMLAAHKSTVNIALANANLRIAAITPDVLAEYKDMLADTTSDLSTHLASVQTKMDRLKAGDAAAVDEVAVEWQAMLEERRSTRLGLDLCAELTARIAEFEAGSTEHAQFSDRPSAHKHIRSVGGSLRSLATNLQAHAAIIDSQLEAMTLQGADSEPVAAQLERLRQTKASISQCISIVADASEAADARSNVFEDITLADNSYALSVSTVGELVTARRLNLSGRSRHLGGQVSDDTVQKSIAAFTQLDTEYSRRLPAAGLGDQGQPASDPDAESTAAARPFNGRFGPGVPLSTQRTA